jgi:hypothetical protein
MNSSSLILTKKSITNNQTINGKFGGYSTSWTFYGFLLKYIFFFFK